MCTHIRCQFNDDYEGLRGPATAIMTSGKIASKANGVYVVKGGLTGT